ncbi:MAG: histidine kinase [Saprospiraceae bacterium]|nr:histidine kinase [Saprospiraceae bacterium]
MNQNKDEIQRLELEKAKKSLVDSIQIQESERARIGADIHDDLGPTMSAIKLKINNLNSEKQVSERDISQLKMMIDETIKSIRSLSHSLYPNTLEKYGLKSAIEELANRINSENLTVTVSIHPFLDNLKFHTQINIYRILQEFCNNSIKYSNCSTIDISIIQSGENVSICAYDNGSGFDTTTDKNHGIGIRNMKMRASAINYDFTLESKINEGTKITLDSIL